MARNAVLTKDQIIKCAFNIARDQGLKSITIREISKQLNKSTAPIYTQYQSIDAIIVDLRTYINELLLAYTLKPFSKNGFLNIGSGFIAFVFENKQIFTDFFLSINGPSFIFSTDDDFYIEQMRKDPLLNYLSNESLNQIYNDMIVYSYGLATMICSNLSPDKDLNYYIEKLEKAGNSIVGYQIYRSGIYEDVVKNLISKKEDLK